MDSLPFADLLGIEIVSATPDKVAARRHVRDELCTRPAVLHDGAPMAASGRPPKAAWLRC